MPRRRYGAVICYPRPPAGFAVPSGTSVRQFILEALCVKDYPRAAKALITAGFLPPLFPVPRLIRLIEETDRHAALLLNGQKADCFLKHFADNGIFFPYSIRCCVFALKKTEELCRTTLKTDGDIWQNGKTEFSDFLAKGKTAPFKQKSNMADIQTAFGPSPHHVERLAIQNKRMPFFRKTRKKFPNYSTGIRWLRGSGRPTGAES